ncbi:MAG: hypothetical protein WAU11_11360 [Ignavibacteriaceae bacterium]
MGFKITEENYETYKRVFAIIWRNTLKSINPDFANVSSPIFPTEILEQWEKKDKKLALKGLKATLSDSLTNINHHRKDILEDIDKDLKEQNLPSLKILLAIIRDHVPKAIKRGKIKSQNEYYIFKELLDDTVSDLTEEERSQLSELMTAYETSKG